MSVSQALLQPRSCTLLSSAKQIQHVEVQMEEEARLLLFCLVGSAMVAGVLVSCPGHHGFGETEYRACIL